MAKFHTVRQTAAGAINLPQPGMYLHRVRMFQASGANIPADMAYLYDGSASAHFPIWGGVAGADIYTEYELNEKITGSQVVAGVFTWTGTISVVEWTFCDEPNGNPDARKFSDYRAILFRRTDAGAVTATITVNWDVGPNKPKAIIAGITPAARGRFQLPATGSFQQQFEAYSNPVWGAGRDVPKTLPVSELPESPSLTLTGISDAAATIQAVVYY